MTEVRNVGEIEEKKKKGISRLNNSQKLQTRLYPVAHEVPRSYCFSQKKVAPVASLPGSTTCVSNFIYE